MNGKSRPGPNERNDFGEMTSTRKQTGGTRRGTSMQQRRRDAAKRDRLRLTYCSSSLSASCRWGGLCGTDCTARAKQTGDQRARRETPAARWRCASPTSRPPRISHLEAAPRKKRGRFAPPLTMRLPPANFAIE